MIVGEGDAAEHAAEVYKKRKEKRKKKVMTVVVTTAMLDARWTTADTS